ncbi:hypothetical protein CesoFtcFv8_000759 [Champsocephalus esox]|uniref:Uncharacterized protein n=1 Tax=Champsocephalus esox TaxID=159716 RepID=A0AAN8D298_9TELE|nr:hypothetical protein CesoFtcFv8_000759 [Champsocephalus esox]
MCLGSSSSTLDQADQWDIRHPAQSPVELPALHDHRPSPQTIFRQNWTLQPYLICIEVHQVIWVGVDFKHNGVCWTRLRHQPSLL